MKEYIIGETYFQIKYFDDNNKFPDIISLIFIGKNLDDLDNSKEEVWFFQDPASYLETGPYSYNGEEVIINEIPENIKETTDVYSCKENCLELFLNLDELIAKLSSWKIVQN